MSMPQTSVIRVLLNGEARALAAPVNVGALVAELSLQGKRIAIERNGAIVPKSRYEETPLADGDRLEIVVAVGGG